MNDLIIEAKSCNGCACWLKHCKAECCKSFYIIIDNPELLKKGDLLKVHTKLSYDLKKYFRLHGIKFDHNTLYVPLDNFRVVEGGILVSAFCSALTDDLLCRLHNNPKQPNICRSPSIKNYHGLTNIRITDNCVYKYKLAGEKHGLV